MKMSGARAAIANAPAAAGWKIGKAPGSQLPLLVRHLEAQFATRDEQRAFGILVRLRQLASPTRCHLHKIMGKCLGESGERSRQHPDTRVIPMRQMADDDIALHTAGYDRICVREDR